MAQTCCRRFLSVFPTSPNNLLAIFSRLGCLPLSYTCTMPLLLHSVDQSEWQGQPGGYTLHLLMGGAANHCGQLCPFYTLKSP